MPPIVNTSYGAIEGITGSHEGVSVFKGIPFAAPPVGNLRWRPPQEPASWEGILKTDHFGPISPQVLTPLIESLGLPMSEDSLYLNVWAPSTESSELTSETPDLKPVLVWIYGGGFHEGTAADPTFDGESLASRGVVVVNFNYRLGALGFLATPELSDADEHGVSGNYGLLDCIQALRWVQQNIEAFGGDPTRVTIAGQSAGAGACNFLTLSPLAKGLFNRVIAQSHARYSRDTELRYLSTSYSTRTNAELFGAQFVANVTHHSHPSVGELRSLDWKELIPDSPVADIRVDTGSRARPPMFRPIIDGWVLPKGYADTYKDGAPNQVEYIAGNNLDEAGAVAEETIAEERVRAASGIWRPGMPPSHVTLNDYVASAHQKFGSMADRFLQLYPANNDDEAALSSNAAARDNSRISTHLWGLDWCAKSNMSVYTYFWTYRSPARSGARRAFHGSEIPYVFANVKAGEGAFTAEDEEMSELASTLWINFISTGNPNSEGAPEWQEFASNPKKTLNLNRNPEMVEVASPSKMEFWSNFFQTQEAW